MINSLIDVSLYVNGDHAVNMDIKQIRMQPLASVSHKTSPQKVINLEINYTFEKILNIL